MDFGLALAVIAVLAVVSFVVGLFAAIGWYWGESLFRG